MTAPDEVCILCGEAKQHMHHVTGRVLDVKLLAPLCQDCHKLIHDCWATAGVGKGVIGDDAKPTTFLEGLALRLTRLGMFLGRLAEAGWGGIFVLTLAVAVAAWAVRLHRCIAVLDERVPQWRGAPEVQE